MMVKFVSVLLHAFSLKVWLLEVCVTCVAWMIRADWEGYGHELLREINGHIIFVQKTKQKQKRADSRKLR